MARTGTAAAALGVAAGIWLLVGVTFGLVAPDRCGLDVCESNGLIRTMVEVVSFVLVAGSVSSFFGPRKIFYLSAALSAVLAGLLLTTGVYGWVALATLGLLVIEILLGVVAARSESRVSEQSHPMNLPVFG
jgi:hypothetical protein